jgi:uncharacterized repeat protein (TIGR03803 family)
MISPNGENSVSRVLHAFCSSEQCADGGTPQGALVLDSAGNIFGAALNGGRDHGGTAYRLEPSGKLRVLHSFCAGTDCRDGGSPNGVIMDGTGQLFGVATNGGKKSGGTAFGLAK